jgi:hypothetical protein
MKASNRTGCTRAKFLLVRIAILMPAKVVA